MSDQANSAPQPDGVPPARRGRGRRITWIAALVVAAGLTGAAATSAFSNGGPAMWYRGGFMAHHGFTAGPFDPAQAADRADRMVRHLAVELDATTEQQDKLRAIVKGTLGDILPMREKMQSARDEARRLLTAPTVDRAGIEKLRSDQIALADTFSKRIAQAIGDAGDVLTPEQRRKLNDLMPPAGFGGGPGRGPFQ